MANYRSKNNGIASSVRSAVASKQSKKTTQGKLKYHREEAKRNAEYNQKLKKDLIDYREASKRKTAEEKEKLHLQYKEYNRQLSDAHKSSKKKKGKKK